MLRLGTITESPEGSMLVGIGPLFCLASEHKREGCIMKIFMVGLGAALVFMTVGIGLLVAKDVKKMIGYAPDPNTPPNGPRRS